jgi:TRAP-type mannitol/chloroaromatic compound transport system substrate-binding protein
MSDKPDLDRRGLLTGAAIGIGAAAGAAGSAIGVVTAATGSSAGPGGGYTAARGSGTRELTMVTSWPKNFPGLGDMAERTAAMIGELTRGELTVKLYAAGELVGALEVFDAVQNGGADMYHAAEYYWQGKSPGFNFFTAVPMGMTAAEIMAWVDFGGGQELWEELSRQFNIVAFHAGNTGHQMGGWFKREINSLADFRGLKMRIPGLGGEVVRALGGSAITLGGPQIYQALESGAIDATEWVGPWNDLQFGFHREAPYYYGPGFHEPGAALAIGINSQVWDSLPVEHQQAVRAAARAVNHLSIGEFIHENVKALDVLVNDHGVQLRSFPDDVWAEIVRISDGIVEASAAGDPLTRRIYESYRAARDGAMRWERISELPYMQRRDAILTAG